MSGLSVVIPVFNEQTQVGACLGKVSTYLALVGYDYEIIVSDDGSLDQTADHVRRWIKEHPQVNCRLLSVVPNRGKGAAAKEGVLAASKDRILLTDVDLSSPIKEVDKLIKVLESKKADIVIGSRAVRSVGCDVQQSFKRRLSGRIFNFFVSEILLSGLKDTQCGFKCFSAQAAKKVFNLQTIQGFCFDVEILYLATREKITIAEVPVMWSQGVDSKVRLLRDSSRMLSDLFKLRKLYGGKLEVPRVQL